jgi:3-hydroxyisobutyrate dehydrogenase-like beta-hydroxyacid dehydrogenase
LLLFAGGDEDAYRRVEPLLHLLGKQIWRFEHAEQASHMKLLCNLFIAGMIATLAQALVFAQKANVDPRTLLEVIGQSQLNLMIEAAEAVGASLPAIEIAQQLLVEGQRAGFGKEDYSAVVKVLQSQTAK